MSDLGYGSFMTLHNSYILPVAGYVAAVWGFKDYPAPRVLQNRINRFYLGVHRFAPTSAVSIEMNTPNYRCIRWMEMLRYHNRVLQLDADRLPRKNYNFDLQSGKDTWIAEICEIAKTLHLPLPTDNVLYDLDVVQQAILKCSKDLWWSEVEEKPKLRTYVLFRDRNDLNLLVRSNLPRYQRSLLSRFACGILPLEVEKGRYVRKNRDERVCKTCDVQVTEDEEHFLFVCKALKSERKSFYRDRFPVKNERKAFKNLSTSEKLRILYSEELIKEFAGWLVTMYQKCQSILYRPLK